MKILADGCTLNLGPYLEHIKADYAKTFGPTEDNPTRKTMVAEFNAGLGVDKTNLYAHVYTRSGGGRSSHSWIVLHLSPKLERLGFKVGDILKSAGWKAPALNFPRGSILTGDFSRVRWTGAG